MELSSLLIRIIFLALPGIIGSRLYRTLQHIGSDKSKKDWEDFIEIVFFSLASYTLFGLGVGIFGGDFTSFQALFDENIPISWYEIVITSLISVPLAFITSFIHYKKLINRSGHFFRVTKTFGDDNVWDYFFNTSRSQEWVFVRDHKLDLCYFGSISVYSDAEEGRELLLRDVDVYNNTTGEHLYKSDVLYVSRESHDLSIEVPTIPSQNIDERSSNE